MLASGGEPVGEDTASEPLREFVKEMQEVMIGNYERTGIEGELRPYEAFMMRIR